MYMLKENSFNTPDLLFTKLDKEGEVRMVMPDVRVARDYFSHGYYERGYINWCLENNFIQSDKNFIDIGAHIGWYTISFAPHAKHVYAFECSPKTFNYLCANIALNDFHYKVNKYNCALSNQTGMTPYYIRDQNDGGGNRISKFEIDEINCDQPVVDVQRQTLDSFQLTNIGFIKIDVEGHEKEVLEGGRQTLINNGYPKILFESWGDNHEHVPTSKLREELFAYLNGLGYRIVKLGTDMFLAEQ